MISTSILNLSGGGTNESSSWTSHIGAISCAIDFIAAVAAVRRPSVAPPPRVDAPPPVGAAELAL